jgi:branched-chain amino acid transport system ATP-binding protein
MLGAYARADQKKIQRDLDNVCDFFPVLRERKRQRAGSLSGGEQQMAAIARTMMGHPTLLMFDEPSLGLAPLLVDQIATIIKDINEQGTTVLLVEQNANMALQMADWAYVLETGEVVLEGSGKDLIMDDHVRRAYLGV